MIQSSRPGKRCLYTSGTLGRIASILQQSLDGCLGGGSHEVVVHAELRNGDSAA